MDRLVEEATVDCYNETEQVSGLYTMIEDNLAAPFETVLFRMKVVELRNIRLLDLPLPSPPPAGAQWIAAYRHWLREEGPTDRENEFS